MSLGSNSCLNMALKFPVDEDGESLLREAILVNSQAVAQMILGRE